MIINYVPVLGNVFIFMGITLALESEAFSFILQLGALPGSFDFYNLKLSTTVRIFVN